MDRNFRQILRSARILLLFALALFLCACGTKGGGDTVTINFVALLTAFYNFAWVFVSAAMVFALMLGGILFALSGLFPSLRNVALGLIKGAFIGFALILLGYMLLGTLSPGLGSITVPKAITIDKAKLRKFVRFDWHPPGTGSSSPAHPKPITDKTYDLLFTDFSACLGTDPAILKVIAFKESGLDATIVNQWGYTGLFQTKTLNCQDAVSQLTDKQDWLRRCDDVTDPVINTATAVGLMKLTNEIIEDICTAIELQDRLLLIYLGHNSGPGAVEYAIRSGGCTRDGVRSGLADFWLRQGKPSEASNRYDYAVSVSDMMIANGVTDFYVETDQSDCPFNEAPPDWP